MADGRLFVCASPIGNLGDITERLAETLRSVDVVYAEDTRRTRLLLDRVGAAPKVRSLFVGNEVARSAELVSDLAAERTVALISDAGMPGVSDPGADAVRMAHRAGFAVTVIPGPSAVTSALAVSGFGGRAFVFEGFLPRKGKDRERALRSIAEEQRPVVLFLSPHRAPRDLADLRDTVGPMREVCVARELTKVHEEVWVGQLAEAAERWADTAKGELTLVIGPGRVGEVSLDDALRLAREEVAAGVSVSDAAKRAAERTGAQRRAIYEALLRDQDEI